jgi:hypothetical protein
MLAKLGELNCDPGETMTEEDQLTKGLPRGSVGHRERERTLLGAVVRAWALSLQTLTHVSWGRFHGEGQEEPSALSFPDAGMTIWGRQR